MPRSWFDSTLLQGQSVAGAAPTGATGNGSGYTPNTAGVVGAQQLEVHETAGGTATLSIQGSFDGITWYAVGYQQVDNIAAPTRVVANITVTANMAHVYQILDPYPMVRAVLSGVAGGAAVIARLYQIGA